MKYFRPFLKGLVFPPMRAVNMSSKECAFQKTAVPFAVDEHHPQIAGPGQLDIPAVVALLVLQTCVQNVLQ